MHPWTGRLIVIALFIAVVLLPVLWQGPVATVPENALRLVAVSPHNEQIQFEFERAFSAWHERKFGRPVAIDWRNIGGTSDMRRYLLSQYRLAAEAGREQQGIGIDVVFGGGDYEFDVNFKPGVQVQVYDEQDKPEIDPETGRPVMRQVSVTQPIEIDSALRAAAFPTPNIADNKLYDPDGHWWGVVLSSFGIAYSQDVLDSLGLPVPTTWADLADPRYLGWVALADPSHSGSVRVTYNAILQRYGFGADADDLTQSGIKTLRRMFANARYFTPSSTKVPVDVSAGEAAAGVCIDFYGRYQSQKIGGGERVGYVSPVGATVVSADPVAVLRGAEHRDLAERFVRFLLTLEGQAVWGFHAEADNRPSDPDDPDTWGPVRFELRRAPIRRDIYDQYRDRLVDQVNPFDIARKLPAHTPNYMSVVHVMLHAMAMDIHEELRTAWATIIETDDPALKRRMLEAFDALPPIAADPLIDAFDAAPPDVQATLERRYPAGVAELHAARDGQTETISFQYGMLLRRELFWKTDPFAEHEDRLAWTAFFRDQYEKVVDMAE